VEPAQGTEENPHPNVAKDATLGWGTRQRRHEAPQQEPPSLGRIVERSPL
jgi:hypothetical protein